MKDFLSLDQLSDLEIANLLSLARQLEGDRSFKALKDKVVGLVFMNPSLRTLASFQTGVGHLGGTSFVIQPGQGSWQLETRDGVRMDGPAQEHINEAIPVLAQYCDILAVRCFAAGTSLSDDLGEVMFKKIHSLCPVPLINMESAADHPCQALADWKTLDDLGIPTDGKFVLSWAYHPKALAYAVPLAAAAMAARRGMDVRILRPAPYALPTEGRQRIEQAAKIGGGQVVETDDRAAAFEGAHVVYCKSWTAPQNYGQPEQDDELRKQFIDWTLDEPWFATARPDAKFMHCLPVRRNVKVSDAVLDGPRSVVIQQAGNRLHAQKAVLAALAGETD